MRRRTRSRASNLPRPWCRLREASSPPSPIAADLSRRSSTSARIAASLARNASERRSSAVGMTGIASAPYRRLPTGQAEMGGAAPSLVAALVLRLFALAVDGAFGRLGQEARAREPVRFGVTINLRQHVFGKGDVDAHGLCGSRFRGDEDRDPVA